jgi:hypothetical protein
VWHPVYYTGAGVFNVTCSLIFILELLYNVIDPHFRLMAGVVEVGSIPKKLGPASLMPGEEGGRGWLGDNESLQLKEGRFVFEVKKCHGGTVGLRLVCVANGLLLL